ncbi:MAG: hypothetical protein LJE91_00340 [Gammaproteobacteria bacterium]|nr:hypothetical protein [Gammaproteobacteria bacterium]
MNVGIRFIRSAGFLLLVMVSLTAMGGEAYKPFVLGAPAGESVSSATASVIAKLKAAGLDVVGQYDPYGEGTATIIGVTSRDLKKAAAGAEYGGFGGVMRVAVTDNDGDIEVSYTNPTYIGYAYSIGELEGVAKQLRDALGGGESFGAQGLQKKKLTKYHYMMLMPYFKDREIIGKFDSHAAAVAALEKALASADSDMRQIWKVDVGNEQTVFGVQLHGGEWRGEIRNIMGKIDIATPKSTAALPWELLVAGEQVVYLPGRYRIALMFPDLSMGQFMQISEVPDRMDESAKALMK